ncbi:amino acid ABC transporter ATP-binding protein [Kaistia sp. 32K]|uniref:amino acid ABC transporter ATP-binding protein n=1 Tax=Kaistia sp. 32K TaxID=2795690 RepID=UPI0019159EDA|nr:amino acid ABC transporter ATP-binding protein [Kaistia sp. 32K]
MLEIVNLRKSWGEQMVLKGIDLRVEPGQVVSLIGASGSGKSTLLRCVNYLETPDAGSAIRINGEQIGSDDPARVSARLLRQQRAQVGMVFQHFNLFPNMTALQNVCEAPLAHRRGSKAEIRDMAMALLERVGLAERAGHYPSQLSGGQQQRVAIARALAMKPKLMLFDEVTSALDPELVDEVLKVMRELGKDGMTMLVVTHEMAFAEDVGDRVIFMADGRILEDGTPRDVLRNPQQERTHSFLSRAMRNR